MEEDSPRPQINASKLRVGGEIVGAIFAIGSMLIFLIGIPVLRYVFPAAVVLGCLLAIARRFVRRRNPGAPWLITAVEATQDNPPGVAKSGDTARRSACATIHIHLPIYALESCCWRAR